MTSLDEVGGKKETFKVSAADKKKIKNLLIIIVVLFILGVSITSYNLFFKRSDIPAGKAIIAVRDYTMETTTTVTTTTTVLTTTTSTTSTTTTSTTSTTTTSTTSTTTSTIAPTKKSVEKSAMCLSSKGVKVYMKDNCYFCEVIKKYFGTSINSFSVIDCSDKDNRDECENMLEKAEDLGKEQGYPTWNVNGELYPSASVQEVLSLTNCG